MPKETLDKRPPVKIVWIANFKYLKQPEIFIRLAKDISKLSYNCEFIMIGSPSFDLQWQYSLEKQIGLLQKLIYIGEKTNDEVNQILAESHILVNTSRYEGLPNTFIQAWMRGVPVISLNSNPDGLLKGSKMGLKSGCYEQLRNDVSLLIENERLRNKLGKEAREFALKKFTMKNAEAVVRVFRDSITEKA
jgi:glycosyltransferase involved in cell wall biosynthesis